MDRESQESLVTNLREEARRADERRVVVLSGGRDATADALSSVVDAADPTTLTVVGERRLLECERIPPARSAELLGTTRDVVVFDAHDRLDPNALGQVVGAVDGGGLFVLLTPPLSEWPDRTDGFDETLAVPPYGPDDVAGHFRRRFVETLRGHPGIAIVDVDEGVGERDGTTDPPPQQSNATVRRPPEAAEFPDAVYEACLTDDQARAVAALEGLSPGPSGDPPPRAFVLEADRGRGKSSAAGLAAGTLAADGADVLVTAPEFRSAREVFERANERLVASENGQPGEDRSREDTPRELHTGAGGSVRYHSRSDAVDAVDEADVVVVDEAAALPVDVLEATLAADRVLYATTVHGYEGTGRGFSVRFRGSLSAADHDVTDVRIDAPIRYAPADPIEAWAFRALLLDARPPVEELVADATPDAVDYRTLTPEQLVADEHLLREAFGLLVLAHYRTEPDDLARLLDAPNVSVRALLYEGHVVSVALLAEEGGLSERIRRQTYEGARIRGHMLPDVLTSQLRDESAGIPRGQRVMRIATHHAVRSRGLGSHLLGRIREEFEGQTDWVGTGFGATPELLRFWRANGYRAVHLSVTRNDRSGEHSVLMLSPVSDAGRDLCERHARRFARRAPAMLSDPLQGVDPDVVRETLRSVGHGVEPDLSDHEWRVVASAAYGPGLFKANPGPFRRLVVASLVDPHSEKPVSPKEQSLLVATILQGRDADDVAGSMGYHSSGECLRAVGDVLSTLVDRYGGGVAMDERERYE